MNKALCYDAAINRLYCGIAGTKDCVFAEHDQKGFKTYKVSIPNNPIEVIISSNLHYLGASYLYAKIFAKGKCLLNFKDTQSLYLTGNRELDTFQVSAGNWEELFETIIYVFNNQYITHEKDIENYFCELDSIIKSNKISIRRNKTDIKTNTWEGSFLVLLHALDIITNVIECREGSVMETNTFLINRILLTCKTFLRRFVKDSTTWELKEEDSRLKRFSEELIGIHHYVNQFGKPLDFTRILIEYNNSNSDVL